MEDCNTRTRYASGYGTQWEIAAGLEAGSHRGVAALCLLHRALAAGAIGTAVAAV